MTKGDQVIIRTLKINFRSILSLHLHTVLLIILGILIMFYYQFDKITVRSFLSVWALDLVPSLYLFITYYIKNQGIEFEIRDSEIIMHKGGKNLIFKNSEIKKIIIHVSPALYKNSNFHLLSIEGYHYARVKLKNGEELVLTCLLAPRIDKSFMHMRGVLIEKRKRLFNML